MILNPSKGNALRLGTNRQLDTFEKFSICYRGAPCTFSGTAPSAGYSYANLTSEVFEEYVQWPSTTTTLTATFPRQGINTIILGGCGFNKAKITIRDGTTVVLSSERPRWLTSNDSNIITHNKDFIVFNRGAGNGVIPLDRDYAPGTNWLDPTDQLNIVIFIKGNMYVSLPATSITFEFTEGTARLYKFWLGNRDDFLLPSTISYPITTKSIGGLTDIGTIYGKKFPIRRGIKIKWDIMDDIHRRRLEDVVNTVQTCTPHWVIPFQRVWDQCYIPPNFVRLKTDQLDNKKMKRGWYWDGPDLEWEVLR